EPPVTGRGRGPGQGVQGQGLGREVVVAAGLVEHGLEVAGGRPVALLLLGGQGGDQAAGEQGPVPAPGRPVPAVVGLQEGAGRGRGAGGGEGPGRVGPGRGGDAESPAVAAAWRARARVPRACSGAPDRCWTRPRVVRWRAACPANPSVSESPAARSRAAAASPKRGSASAMAPSMASAWTIPQASPIGSRSRTASVAELVAAAGAPSMIHPKGPSSRLAAGA